NRLTCSLTNRTFLFCCPALLVGFCIISITETETAHKKGGYFYFYLYQPAYVEASTTGVQTVQSENISIKTAFNLKIKSTERLFVDLN
uniref:Uncharacterized protein n=1 Tax=Oryzias sinensis TaxID=183150 RepID=A0A8C7YYL3_9TELE